MLLRAVHEQLQRLSPETFQRDTFLLRACPDGEGNWFGEIAPDLAATLRYKKQWDEAFVTGMTAQIRALTESKRLLLVDLGGRIDRRTQSILNCCHAAVIVSRDPEHQTLAPPPGTSPARERRHRSPSGIDAGDRPASGPEPRLRIGVILGASHEELQASTRQAQKSPSTLPHSGTHVCRIRM